MYCRKRDSKLITGPGDIPTRDRRECSRKAFPMGKSCLKVYQNALTEQIPDFSPGLTDQFLGFRWVFNTYLPIGKACREHSHRCLMPTIPKVKNCNWDSELRNRNRSMRKSAYAHSIFYNNIFVNRKKSNPYSDKFKFCDQSVSNHWSKK